MPLELGIFLGAKRFGEEARRSKRCLILDIEPWRYQRFISDLAGMDISAHGGDLFVALESLRDWLANVSRKRVLGSVRLVNLYRRFLAEKQEIAVSLGHDPERIPYVDFERIVTQWVAIYRV